MRQSASWYLLSVCTNTTRQAIQRQTQVRAMCHLLHTLSGLHWRRPSFFDCYCASLLRKAAANAVASGKQTGCHQGRGQAQKIAISLLLLFSKVALVLIPSSKFTRPGFAFPGRL